MATNLFWFFMFTQHNYQCMFMSFFSLCFSLRSGVTPQCLQCKWFKCSKVCRFHPPNGSFSAYAEKIGWVQTFFVVFIFFFAFFQWHALKPHSSIHISNWLACEVSIFRSFWRQTDFRRFEKFILKKKNVRKSVLITELMQHQWCQCIYQNVWFDINSGE